MISFRNADILDRFKKPDKIRAGMAVWVKKTPTGHYKLHGLVSKVVGNIVYVSNQANDGYTVNLAKYELVKVQNGHELLFAPKEIYSQADILDRFKKNAPFKIGDMVVVKPEHKLEMRFDSYHKIPGKIVGFTAAFHALPETEKAIIMYDQQMLGAKDGNIAEFHLVNLKRVF